MTLDPNATDGPATPGADDETPAEPVSAAPGEASPAPAGGKDELAELRDRWLRAEAEIQNVRRRAAREREEQRREIEDQWLLEMASLHDDLERGVAAAREAGAAESWIRGVELVNQRVREVLARHGVTPIEGVGEPFDPNRHEALLEMPAHESAAAGTVMQTVTRGYARGGRALRAAKVVVARSRDEEGS